MPAPLSLFVFIPFINLLFYAILAILPEVSLEEPDEIDTYFLDRIIPRSYWGSASLGVFISATLGLLGMMSATEYMGIYAYGLFFGLPFSVGLISTLIFAYHEERSLRACILIALVATMLLGLLIFVLAFEGIICLVMAMPIALILAILGAGLGYVIQPKQPRQKKNAFMTILALTLSWPILTGAESKILATPPIYTMTAAIEIIAPPETVWKNLTSFSDMQKPTAFPFQKGVAYPIRAETKKVNHQWVRKITFSKGYLLESIDSMNAPYFMSFKVDKAPEPMQEWSYKEIHPRHLDDYVKPLKGEYRLVRVGQNHTHLQGTVWYRNNIWPSSYWATISDILIHESHMQILNHIRTISETKS